MVMNKKPVISIIVPVYNVEQRLDRCVESLVKQTYDNLQIILINDGSKDRSGEICDSWAKKDPRVHVIHQPNMGVSRARNAGLDAAKGDYVAFVDSDDYVDQNMFMYQVVPAVENNADQSCCYICNVYGTQKIIEHHAFNDQVIRDDAVNSELIMSLVAPDQQGKKACLLQSPCNKLYRRSIIEENKIRFDVELTYAEDWLFNLCFYRFCRCVAFVPEVLYYYDRTTEGSLSKKFRWNGFEQSYKIRSTEKEWFPHLHTEESFRNLILRVQSHYLNLYVACNGYKDFSVYAKHLFENKSLQEIYCNAPSVPFKYRLPRFCFRKPQNKLNRGLYVFWATVHVLPTGLKSCIKKIIRK